MTAEEAIEAMRSWSRSSPVAPPPMGLFIFALECWGALDTRDMSPREAGIYTFAGTLIRALALQARTDAVEHRDEVLRIRRAIGSAYGQARSAELGR